MQQRIDAWRARVAIGLGLLLFGCAGASPARSGPPVPASPPPTLAIDCDLAALVAGPGARVDARLQVGAEEARATIALAGETGSEPLSALVVDLKGKHRLLHMRRFSLHEPAALGFLQAAVVSRQLQREGVLVPRTRIVRLTLNGLPRGVRIVQEGFSKELPESQQRREGGLFQLRASSLPVARLVAFGAKKVSEDPQLAREADTARGLLGAFLSGTLPAGDVFDVDLMGRFLAVAELWQAESMVHPVNLRFYFNPVTQRLEPVGFAARPEQPKGAPFVRVSGAAWPTQLLADAGIRAVFERNLRRLVGELQSGDLARWVAEVEAPLLAGLPPDVPAAGPLDLTPWSARAAALSGVVTAPPSTGAGELIADPEGPRLAANPIPRAEVSEVTARHGFLTLDAERRTLRSAPGVWDVAGSLILPDGFGLELTAGTTLRFGEGEMLVASGPLRFLGEPERPVVLTAKQQGGVQGTWGGLVALASPTAHEWRSVEVRNTAGIDRGGWRLTGGVTVRAAEIAISDSSFVGNRAEDALNLIRSRFTFRGVSIRGAASDAFDCDFCEGRIVGGHIADVGGDGVDVSGSTVELDGTVIEDVRDKAISVGEGSRVVARRVRIAVVGTALAGKDGSDVIFAESEVSGVRHVAVMAYVKKEEYGPARVTVRNVRMHGVETPAVAQVGSWIEIDGAAQPVEEVDVEALYKRGYMKK